MKRETRKTPARIRFNCINRGGKIVSLFFNLILLFQSVIVFLMVRKLWNVIAQVFALVKRDIQELNVKSVYQM